LTKDHKHEPFSGITGGLTLILLGAIFLLANMGYISWGEWWAYFLVGLGVILIVDAFIRGTTRKYRKQRKGKLLGGAILIVIGGSQIFHLGTWWPLILIVVGIYLIFSSLTK